MDEASGSVVYYLLTAIGSLAASVVFLFGLLVGVYRDAKAAHKECEGRNEKLFERVIRLEERTGTERRSPSP